MFERGGPIHRSEKKMRKSDDNFPEKKKRKKKKSFFGQAFRFFSHVRFKREVKSFRSKFAKIERGIAEILLFTMFTILLAFSMESFCCYIS